MLGSSDITRLEREALDGLPPGERPYLSAISLWEVAMLVELTRLSLDLPLADWLSAAAHPRTVRLVSITPVIAAGTATLPSTFHRDPADRIIVATCRNLDAPLLTHDRLIRRSRLVRRWRPEG
jgi:PIN domain nuclease of toxin-antitoxin system